MCIYKAASTPIKCQLWLAVSLCVVFAVATLQAEGTAPGAPPDWFTRENVLLGIAVVFTGASIYQQFKDVRDRLLTQEQKHRALVDSHLPDTYARKDVIEEQFRALRELLEQRPPSWRGAHHGSKE